MSNAVKFPIAPPHIRDRLFLSIRCIEARVAAVADLGHAWLHWGPQVLGKHAPYRGFYPDLGKVPAGVIPKGSLERGDFSWARTFLFDNAVPGLQRVDKRAQDLYERSSRKSIRQKTYDMTPIQHLRLEYRCRMPPDMDWRSEGFYSFNQTKPNWDNCVSWAVKRCREARESEDDPPLPNPARIKDFFPLLREQLSPERDEP